MKQLTIKTYQEKEGCRWNDVRNEYGDDADNRPVAQYWYCSQGDCSDIDPYWDDDLHISELLLDEDGYMREDYNYKDAITQSLINAAGRIYDEHVTLYVINYVVKGYDETDYYLSILTDPTRWEPDALELISTEEVVID